MAQIKWMEMVKIPIDHTEIYNKMFETENKIERRKLTVESYA